MAVTRFRVELYQCPCPKRHLCEGVNLDLKFPQVMLENYTDGRKI